jgi:DNA-directed RNA polymerase subunit RPC12/RpoP
MSLTNPDVTITCDCGRKFTKSLGQLQADPRATCPACGSVITIDHKLVLAQLAELRKTIAKFNRR